MLQNQLYRISAGYSGECNVDHYLERVNFPFSSKILTDVHLSLSSFSFQIDTLLVTENYIMILEVKNLAESVRFIQNPPHLKQELKNGTQNVINCPVYQLKANQKNLQDWLLQHDIRVPIQTLLVLANPNTNVLDAPADFPMIFHKQLPFYLQSMATAKPKFTKQQIEHITSILQADQRHFNPFPLCTYYDIPPSDLKTGLFCNTCHNALLQQNRETWYCLTCKKTAMTPYQDGIDDWLMLVKSSLTNEECRSFLQLKDKYASYYVLRNSSLRRYGKSTATFYANKHAEKPFS